MELTEKQKHVMTHTLTGSNGKARSHRNFFAASKGHHSMSELETLVNSGFMIVGEKYGENGNYYHCTESGAKAVGLKLPLD
jgi:hypothetical protein